MKVKELIEHLSQFDGNLEIYLQDLTTHYPSPRVYSMATLRDCFVCEQRDGNVKYLAIGDCVTKEFIGYDVNGEIIEYVDPTKEE